MTDTTPLTDDELANIRDNLAEADRSADPWEVVPNYRAVRGLLTEVDRLRAALDQLRAVADRVEPHANNMAAIGELEVSVPLKSAVRDIRAALAGGR